MSAMSARRRALAVAAGTVAVTLLAGIGLAQVASAHAPVMLQHGLNYLPYYSYSPSPPPPPPPPTSRQPPPPPTSPTATGPGGGGGGGQDPAGNPQPVPPEQQDRVARTGRGLARAKQALRDNPDCAEFLNSTVADPAYTPPPGRDAISMLEAAPFQIMTEQRPGALADTPVTTYRRGGNEPGTLIRMYPSVFDSRHIDGFYRQWQDHGLISRPEDFGARLSDEEFLALIILHELGHQLGTIPTHPSFYTVQQTITTKETQAYLAWMAVVVFRCLRPPARPGSAAPATVLEPGSGTAGATADLAAPVDRRSPIQAAWECARDCAAFPVDTRVGPTFQAPAVVTSPSGRTDAFTVGDDQAVWHSYQATSGGEWTPWTSLGGVVFGELTAVLNADGRVAVFAHGGGWGIFYNQQQSPGGPFTGWQGLPDRRWAYGSLTVARHPDGRLEAFAMNFDDFQMYSNWQTTPGGSWSGWHRFGNLSFAAGRAPSTVVNAAGRIEIFAYHDNGVIVRMADTGSGWSGWTAVNNLPEPGVSPGRIHPVRHPDGRIHLFAKLTFGLSTHSGIYHAWQTSPGGGFTGWTRLGSTDVNWELQAAVVNASGQVEVYARDGRLVGSGLPVFQGRSVAQTRECATCSGGWSEWTPLTPPGLVAAGPPVPAGVRYTLANRLSGRCLDGSTTAANGATAYQWDCVPAAGNHRWRLDRAGDGSVLLVAEHSGKCLDVATASTADGAAVHQWDCHGGANQRWWLMPAGNGRHQLVNVNSRMCLAVARNGTANGAAVIQENCGYQQLDERWLLTAVEQRTRGDFTGDGRTELAVYRPSTQVWHRAGMADQPFGAAGDIPVAGDFDGDHRADPAVYRPSNDHWYWLSSARGSTVETPPFGQAGDILVPADYDGDGATDPAVYRPSTAQWLVLAPNGELLDLGGWGLPGDIPVPGDYDGDGRTDRAIWRPADGMWWIFGTRNGPWVQQWGAPGDEPVPGDYNADGRTDAAVYRPGANWYVFGVLDRFWGVASDVRVPADYDGDRRTDTAIWRPGDGHWWVVNSATGSGVDIGAYGAAGDVAVPRAGGQPVP
jgi:ricin-type beta-trefoil lectin protein